MPTPTASTRRRYGWRPDVPDHRDHVAAVTAPTTQRPLPRACLYLPLKLPAPYDQTTLGSCTGNGIALLAAWRILRQGLPLIAFSRLFIYYCERVIEGTVAQDAGAEIRDGMKALAQYGVPPERLWPYKVKSFATKPPRSVYAEALKHRATGYARVPMTLDAIRSAVALDASPVVFGFSVYESFEGDEIARTGQMVRPLPSERLLGGHCTVIVGYDDDHDNGPGCPRGAFLVRNSWGSTWGINDPAHPEFAGHFWFPYDVFMSPGFADDLWVLSQTVDTAPAPPPAGPPLA